VTRRLITVSPRRPVSASVFHPRQLIVICGAVAAGLLTAENAGATLVNVTCIGTSPAPARDAGRVKVIKSQPGISGFG